MVGWHSCLEIQTKSLSAEQQTLIAGRLYEVDLVRDASSKIIGFSGTATAYGDVGEYNDGGVVFGPNNVLFTARWPQNELGQTLPGSFDENKIIDLTPLGVSSSISALNFVPNGFAGGGQMKIVTWSTGDWYTASFVADGMGTLDILCRRTGNYTTGWTGGICLH